MTSSTAAPATTRSSAAPAATRSSGERGKDRYLGGAGRDRLWLQNVDAPEVRCGTGTDTAFVFKRTDARLHDDC